MSWLIFPANFAKIMFLGSHAKNLHVRTYLDVFLISAMARSWQDLPRFCTYLIKMYQVSVHGVSLGTMVDAQSQGSIINRWMVGDQTSLPPLTYIF